MPLAHIPTPLSTQILPPLVRLLDQLQCLSSSLLESVDCAGFDSLEVFHGADGGGVGIREGYADYFVVHFSFVDEFEVAQDATGRDASHFEALRSNFHHVERIVSPPLRNESFSSRSSQVLRDESVDEEGICLLLRVCITNGPPYQHTSTLSIPSPMSSV